MTRLNLMGAGMLLLGAVGLAACQPATAPTPALPAATEAVVASPTEMPVPTAAATTDALTGNWTLVSYGPADAPVPLPEGVEVTANFANGTVSGRSGCNNYTATYVLMGDVLTITPGISTMMACEDPQMKVETEYMAALAAVTGYALPEGGLSLQFGAGQVLVFKAAASGLAGTSWDVTSYNNGKEAVVSLAVGTAITLMFADGQATGKACNNYFGPFTEDGEKVTIGPLANTRMMCVEEGVMEQEAMYMTALQAAATWSVDGSMLTLRDASGATQVVGTAATTTTP